MKSKFRFAFKSVLKGFIEFSGFHFMSEVCLRLLLGFKHLLKSIHE